MYIKVVVDSPFANVAANFSMHSLRIIAPKALGHSAPKAPTSRVLSGLQWFGVAERRSAKINFSLITATLNAF